MNQPEIPIAEIYAAKTPGEAEMEKQLALMTGAIADCLSHMSQEDRSPFHDMRRQESHIAADFLRLSREFAVSLSKIRKRYQQAANLADLTQLEKQV
ncbi:MAG TPA: hypothetical protein VGM36_16415 [Rhizomicrobium sp.]|jgi:hypothetical protein